MKHGMVIQFRLNPEDVMSCIDVLDVSGIPQNNMSLPMVCRLVLSSFLQGARDKGMIPKREGYEYTSMVGRFSNISVASKIAAANNIFNIEVKNHISGIENKHMNVMQHGVVQQTQHQMKRADDEFNTPEALLIKKKGRVMNAIIELEARRAADADNFSPEQHKKFIALNTALVQLDNGVDVDVRTLLE